MRIHENRPAMVRFAPRFSQAQNHPLASLDSNLSDLFRRQINLTQTKVRAEKTPKKYLLVDPYYHLEGTRRHFLSRFTPLPHHARFLASSS